MKIPLQLTAYKHKLGASVLFDYYFYDATLLVYDVESDIYVEANN